MKRKSNNRKYRFDYNKFAGYLFDIALLISAFCLAEALFRLIDTIGGTTVRHIIAWSCITIYIISSCITSKRK